MPDFMTVVIRMPQDKERRQQIASTLKLGGEFLGGRVTGMSLADEMTLNEKLVELCGEDVLEEAEEEVAKVHAAIVTQSADDLLAGDPRKTTSITPLPNGRPGLLTTVGSVIFHVGWFFLLAGLFGPLLVIINEGITPGGFKSLAELYPQLPLWWVPESMPAMVLAIVATMGGAYIRLLGCRVDRLHQAS